MSNYLWHENLCNVLPVFTACFSKGYLLAAERSSIGLQKDTFCNLKGNLL